MGARPAPEDNVVAVTRQSDRFPPTLSLGLTTETTSTGMSGNPNRTQPGGADVLFPLRALAGNDLFWCLVVRLEHPLRCPLESSEALS